MTVVRSLLGMLSLALVAQAQTLAINEFLASNNTCCTDEHGDHDDWVELYNYGSEPVDLAGLWFSDHAGESGTQIPDDDDEITTVAPGGFIVVWFDEEPDQGLLHVDSKLSAGGESIIVYLEDGVTELVRHDFGPQTSDVSMGRVPDGSGEFTSIEEPTPGASNGGTAVASPVARPVTPLLLEAWPNPFNPSTTLAFRLEQPARTVLSVVDLKGRLVFQEESGLLPAGQHRYDWAPAAGLASGLYIVHLQAGTGSAVQKVLFTK